ncbi:MAG: WD40/YVTN/BNR-like repeat-containing protein [Acidimicrobiales bacterium]
MGAGNATVPKRRHRRGLSLTLVALAVFIVAAGTAYVVADNRRPAPLDTGPGSVPRGVAKVLPGVGAFVPAYDLTSDPVFPTLTTGYAIESHRTKAGTSEQLARSDDGGRSWHLVGPFPFPNGYAQVQFYSLRDGYAFGPAGLAVTYDGGSIWKVGAQLDGTLERVSPIGNNVWATYTVCRGFPLTPTTSCNVRLAVSQDAGLHWSTQATPSPLSEARSGGDILARDTLDKAYIVSYGVTGGGGLAVTGDGGRSWQTLPDPCSAWLTVDMAALSGGLIWMICGGPPVLDGQASAKAVFQSHDGGHHWTLESYTGFGPPAADWGAAGPVGELWYAGQLSQLATIAPGKAWIGVTGVGVLVSSDSGREWELAGGLHDDGHDSGVGVTFNNAEDGWAIEFHESVWRTTDAVHWQLVDGK